MVEWYCGRLEYSEPIYGRNGMQWTTFCENEARISGRMHRTLTANILAHGDVGSLLVKNLNLTKFSICFVTLGWLS